MTRLAILASHPVQYYAPLFRALAKRLDLTVFYAHDANANDQARAGFGIGFEWDVDLLSGYKHSFLVNVAHNPGLDRFGGVDTPEIRTRLQEGRFDVLLVMGWYQKSFIQGLIAAKRLGVPVMVRGDSHLDTPRNFLKVFAKRIVYPLFLRSFDAALVVGKRNRTYWEHYGYPKNRIFEAPHCVDNAFFAGRATPEERKSLRESLGVKPETKLALLAGKLIPLKRPFDVIDAIAINRATGYNLELLIAGSGPLEDEVRERGKQKGVPIHFLGFYNQTEMPQAYAAADTLVMCSESETWGLVVNEALASGTPAIIADSVGCAPDLADLFGCNAVFQMGNVSELAEKLSKFVQSPPSSTTIRDAADAFDLERVADKIAYAVRALDLHNIH